MRKHYKTEGLQRPLDLSDMVPENHMARVVDEVVESLDLTALMSLYPGGGAGPVPATA